MQPKGRPQGQGTPGFDAAKIERETDEWQDESFESEMPIVSPSGEGAEIVDRREDHAEAPPQERGYRNLDETP